MPDGANKPEPQPIVAAIVTSHKVHNGLRNIGERGNSLLKTTFRGCVMSASAPGRSAIVAAALASLHLEHDRTT